MNPRFTAFYSYKGGVGRSMIACNFAYLAAKEGKKVLLIDFDLEAPGLHRSDLFEESFHDDSSGGRKVPGLVDLIVSWGKSEEPGSFESVRKLPSGLADHIVFSTEAARGLASASNGSVSLLPAGTIDASYHSTLAAIDWERFYATENGGEFFQALRREVLELGFEEVVVDCRTGLTDTAFGGMLLLSDSVVLVSALNRQNQEGIARVRSLLENPATQSTYGAKRVLNVLSPIPPLSLHEVGLRLAELDLAYGEAEAGVAPIQVPYAPELGLRETTIALKADLQSAEALSEYLRAMERVFAAINSPDDRAALSLKQPFTNNPFVIVRADYEHDESWIPYYVDPGDSIKEALEQLMPAVIEGSRGSGKTTLARNLSFEASLHRKQSRSAIRQIGLYFRLDVDLLRAFDLEDPDLRPRFDRLFGQFWDILVVRKSLDALTALDPSYDYWFDGAAWIRLVDRLCAELGMQKAKGSGAAEAINHLRLQLEDRVSEIRRYINNPGTESAPYQVQANILIKLVVEALRSSRAWRGRYFVILVDEYENFRAYQQQLVNTRLKQSKADDAMTYKLFVRHGGLHTSETEAKGQNIQHIHDYRRFVIDEELSFDEYYAHAKRVVEKHLQLSEEFRRHGVLDPERLFESSTPESEAQRVLQTGRSGTLIGFLEKNIPNCRERDLFVDWLATEPHALRKAVAVVVVNQRVSRRPEQVRSHLADTLRSFVDWDSRARDWYHNYHRGALFWLHTLARTRKRYFGFRDIVGLSGYNIRYLLDFCYAVCSSWLRNPERSIPISGELQSEAIIERPESYYRSLAEEGKTARDLQRVVDRLGRIFEAAHKSPTQSEPEINHFSISGELDDVALELLKSAHSAGVLRRLTETKQKSLGDLRGDAWQLHPRFHPRFGLSWRRKKLLKFSVDEARVIFRGTDDEWGSLFEKLSSRFEASGDDLQMAFELTNGDSSES